MHSIIVPCVEEEPLVTAEQVQVDGVGVTGSAGRLVTRRCFSVQVIEEIEEMMQDSPDADAQHRPSRSDLSTLSLDVQLSSPGFEDSECSKEKKSSL